MGGPYNPLNPCKHISMSTIGHLLLSTDSQSYLHPPNGEEQELRSGTKKIMGVKYSKRTGFFLMNFLSLSLFFYD